MLPVPRSKYEIRIQLYVILFQTIYQMWNAKNEYHMHGPFNGRTHLRFDETLFGFPYQ